MPDYLVITEGLQRPAVLVNDAVSAPLWSTDAAEGRTMTLDEAETALDRIGGHGFGAAIVRRDQFVRGDE